MEGFKSLMLPKTLIAQKLASMKNDSKVVATSGTTTYDLNYYLKGALAGGICCAITHGALW
jgi:hypothetical protein